MSSNNNLEVPLLTAEQEQPSTVYPPPSSGYMAYSAPSQPQPQPQPQVVHQQQGQAQQMQPHGVTQVIMVTMQ